MTIMEKLDCIEVPQIPVHHVTFNKLDTDSTVWLVMSETFRIKQVPEVRNL